MNPLVDRQTEVKPWLSIDLADATYDVVLDQINRAVTQSIANYCSTDFAQMTITGELCDGGRSDTLIPLVTPIISVQRLIIGISSDNPTASGRTLDVTKDILVTEATVILKNGFYFPQGRGIIWLDYTAGYAAVPENVKMAALLSIEAMYNRRSRSTVGISSRSKQGEAESYSPAWDTSTGLPKEALGLLDSYRNFEWPSLALATRNV